MQPVVSGLELLFARFQAVGQAARPCRFSILILIVGAGVMIFPSQSAEALTTLCVRTGRLPLYALMIATLWWAHTTWYFARILSKFAYPDRAVLPPEVARLHDWLIIQLPRALGALCFVVVGVAILVCTNRTKSALAPGIAALALGGVFYGLVVARRVLLVRYQADFASSRNRLIKSIGTDANNPRRIGELPDITLVILALHEISFIVLLFFFTKWPVACARWTGAPTILVAAFAAWIAAGSIVTYISSWLRFPVFALLAAEAVLVSPLNDNHRLAYAKHDHPSIAADFAAWQTATHSTSESPVIIVATEGGGIRAAYWTATLLTMLQERDPRFSSHVYAISSASGGSVGAAVFDGLLASGQSTFLPKRAGHILSADFLAPPLAKMLYPDLVQRFLPIAFPSLDRGKALEDAWSSAMATELVSANLLEEPLENVWVNHTSLPRLFLNATWVETGQRVVLSHPSTERTCLDVVQDSSELTLVQAVHASARFPYISPPATVVDDRGAVRGHLVDGGYFDNSGAVTAEEIAEAIENADEAVRRNLRVVIIRYNDTVPGGPSADKWATELTAPPATMVRTRVARESLALAKLDARNKVTVAEFVLQPATPDLPLGWMLSENAQHEIDEQAVGAVNGPAGAKILEWLR